MKEEKVIANWLEENLVCPADYTKLVQNRDFLICEKKHKYPYVDGIAILLLKGIKPTHESCVNSLKIAPFHTTRKEDGSLINGIDAYVQKRIPDTCGIMYRPLVGKLFRYPIPNMRLSDGSGKFLLDIGCNWGRWSISAAKKNYYAIGIDPSFEAIRAARRVASQLGMKNVHYIVADARYLPFSANSFDIVFSYSVLQHFDKDEVKRALSGISRILKKRGTCLIQMPNKFGIVNLIFQFMAKFKKPQLFDVRYWSPLELKKTFNELVGHATVGADGYFSLNSQYSDIDIMPMRFKIVFLGSEILTRLSGKISRISYLADSLYVKSIRK